MSQIVSIITPLFNRARLIADTIESVVSQSSQHWEMLIIDDHSTDRSLEATQKIAISDSRIKVWKRRGNTKGAPVCRNEGLAEASGDYVIFLDSDDLLSPSCVETRLAAYAKNPDFDFQLFPSEQFRKLPGDLGVPWFRHAEDPLTAFLKQPLWQTTAAIWKTESIRSLNGFREDLLAWQDWDLFVRALIQQQKFKTHTDAEPDNFIRRALHDRISLHAAREKKCLTNRTILFRDLYDNLESAGLLNSTRLEALRKLFVGLATQMHISGLVQEADRWIEELPSFKLIEKDEVEDTQLFAKKQSRLSLNQRINEGKAWVLKLLHKIRRGKLK